MAQVKWNIKAGDRVTWPIKIEEPSRNVFMWKITNKSNQGVEIHDGFGSPDPTVILPPNTSRLFILKGTVVITATNNDRGASGQIQYLTRIN